MTVAHLEVLVEEPSMEAALAVLLPKLTPLTFTLHSHQGKADLLKRLPAKLRGYSRWLLATSRVLIVVDRDNADCLALKQQLREVIESAGFVEGTKGVRATQDSWHVVSRVAIEELEAWYFGDWEAVRSAYPKVPKGVPNQERYRHPDEIAGGTWEALERVMKEAGYFKTGLRKIEAARNITQYMDPARNRSPSFIQLRSLIAELTPPG